jgi:SAM-dependent methyltransferase
LVSDPADYAEEAVSFIELMSLPADRHRSLLELGSGGGNLASHLKASFAMTLCDRSAEMLAVSRSLNPELDHVQGDMRTVRLNREFDVVLIHDAIMYCTTPGDVQAALGTAAVHCRRGGVVVVAPDCLRETFAPATSTGGGDGADGRSLRFLEWSFDPDPDDTTFETLYALVLREPSGDARVVLDRHVEGMFAESEWLEWFRQAGLSPRMIVDAWSRPVFIGRADL